MYNFQLKEWPSSISEDIQSNSVHTTCQPKDFFNLLPQIIDKLFNGTTNLLVDKYSTKMECHIRCINAPYQNYTDYKFDVELFESHQYKIPQTKKNNESYNNYDNNNINDDDNRCYDDDEVAHSKCNLSNDSKVYIARIKCLEGDRYKFQKFRDKLLLNGCSNGIFSGLPHWALNQQDDIFENWLNRIFEEKSDDEYDGQQWELIVPAFINNYNRKYNKYIPREIESIIISYVDINYFWQENCDGFQM